MADTPAVLEEATTVQVPLLLLIRELVESMEDDWTLGYARYLRTMAGGSPIVIMPFVFLKKGGTHVEGNYWDTESHGSPEWACDIVGSNEIPLTRLEERIRRLAAVGIEEVLVVTLEQAKTQLQVWRRGGGILKPQQASNGRAFSDLLQVWFVGQADGTVRIGFGDQGECLVPDWDEFVREPNPLAATPVEHARAAAQRRNR